ncbi:FprA family A-type flavoprotein [Saccharicrinis sp. FJH54]|uniref:FprA family A-type flavoprotein n=1 Tax=Saccharicrinis sp. FJH54 TaxID=3344665 RepID=UPI0035D516BD
MYTSKQIKGDIYYVGVNDRKTERFENMWPIPRGVSYNSYLIMDEKVALIDTVEISFVEQYLKKIETVLKGRNIDYLIVDHIEPDHGGSIRMIKNRFPEITIVGNKKTFDMLDGFFGMECNKLEVKEGDSLTLGKNELQFYTAPMVHWPEVMVTYNATEKVLFSADAFGTWGTLDGGIFDTDINLDHIWDEMRRYYSNIVGKYGNPVQKALSKLSGLDIEVICSTHGPVWTTDIPKVVGKYDTWSKYEPEESGVVIAYGSMYGNTEEMAETIANAISENGVKNIVMHDVSKSHASYIISDIWKYNGLIVGSPTYSNQLFPLVQALLDKIKIRGVKNRLFSYFGSYAWSGATHKHFQQFAEELNLDVVGIPVEEKLRMTDAKLQECLALGAAMAEKIKSLS